MMAVVLYRQCVQHYQMHVLCMCNITTYMQAYNATALSQVTLQQFTTTSI